MDKIIPDNVRDEIGGSFLSGADFEQGLTLTIVSMTAVAADSPKFGSKDGGNGLKAGETWEYILETENGAQKVFKSTSARLAGAISRINPSKGDKLFIKRSEDKGYDTTWEVNAV